MFARFLRTLHIYAKLQFLHLRIHMEYRLDFFVGVLGAFVQHLTGFVFITALFTTIPEIQGWSLWEMAFLYGLLVIPRGLVELLFDGTWRLRLLISTGEFDRLLLRPLSPLIQVFTQIFTLHSFGTTGLGILVLAYSSAELGLEWNIGKILFLLLTLFASSMLIASINFATNCIGFWEPNSTSTVPFLIVNTAELAKFPIELYAPTLQFIFSWILPYAFISYYPGLVLLNRPETSWLSYISIIPATIAMLLASVIWHSGLSRYQSAGH
jgi:ABC-2 type transport system permease protein